jgi:hypothetical protein
LPPHIDHPQAVGSIPQSTLQSLLPVLAGIDSSKLTAQLKLLGQQDKATLDKMVYFLKAVSTVINDVLAPSLSTVLATA